MASVAQLMIRNVSWVKPDAPILEALHEMSRYRISCLPVCEEDALVGIVTERDLVGLAARALEGAELGNVGEVMSRPVVTVSPSQSAVAARRLAEEHGIRHLPVIGEAGELVGILTQTDLTRSYAREIEQVVTERTLELEQANRCLEAMALQDGLLGIRNRRAMELDLNRIHAVHRRYGRSYAVVLCDLDDFKLYNDQYGHLAGDDALRRVAQRISDEMRGADAVYRYGGEELLVLLAETDGANGRLVAERICTAIESLSIAHAGSEYAVLTISCGVAAADDPKDDPGGWIQVVAAADEALYRAKSNGRNQIA